MEETPTVEYVKNDNIGMVEKVITVVKREAINVPQVKERRKKLIDDNENYTKFIKDNLSEITQIDLDISKDAEIRGLSEPQD